LRRERGNHTLQTDALVNEAYLRLVDLSRVEWRDRVHFLALSARLMRRILVDYARSKNYQKRGGDVLRIPLDETQDLAITRGADLVALDEALDALAAVDARKAQVIELRFFGGCRGGCRDPAGRARRSCAIGASPGVAAAGAFRRQIMIPKVAERAKCCETPPRPRHPARAPVIVVSIDHDDR
jgi:hypothetical protein